MGDKPQQQARKEVRHAQSTFERMQGQLERAREVRRKSFEHAQEQGLSVRDIAKEAGLHYTRVAQILRK